MALSATDLTLDRRGFRLRVSVALGAETLAVVGPSGAGKTTLLRVLAGLEHPTAGRISLGDEVWLDRERGIEWPPERRRVGYLPQDYGLFPHLTVAGNVRFAAGRARPDLLERFGLGHLGGARPQELSGGERQRAALARALARSPRVLLLDEPFGALDVLTRGVVRDELADLLVGLELPVLLVTHAFADAVALARRVAVMVAGRIVQLEAPDALQRRPVSALVAGLVGLNVLRGRATPASGGSRISIDGGGFVQADTPAEGPVSIAVAPWALRLVPPGGAAPVRRVVSAHREGGTSVIRLDVDGVTVHLPVGQATPPVGELVGIDADRADVRIIAPLEGRE